MRTYEEIVREHGPLDPETDETADGVWYFNGVATAMKKAEMSATLGLGGVFLWEAGQDAKADDSSLLSHLGRFARSRRMGKEL